VRGSIYKSVGDASSLIPRLLHILSQFFFLLLIRPSANHFLMLALLLLHFILFILQRSSLLLPLLFVFLFFQFFLRLGVEVEPNPGLLSLRAGEHKGHAAEGMQVDGGKLT
jgi:hypothetical protein